MTENNRPKMAPLPATVPASAYSTRPPDASIDERIMQGALKGNGRGLWTGFVLGFLTGAIMGAIAAFAPFVMGFVGLSAAASLAGPCAIVFGMLGMAKASGFISTAGMVAGGVSSATKEVLGEVKASEARLTGLLSTAFPQLKNVKITTEQDIEKQEEAEKLKALHERKGVGATLSKLFNWKVMLSMACIGALGGLAFGMGIAALGPTTPVVVAAKAIMGTAGLEALTPSLMVVSGMFGSLFGVNVSLLINKTIDGFGYLMSGRIFERKKEEPAPAQNITPVIEQGTTSVVKLADAQEQETTKHRDMVTAQRQVQPAIAQQAI